MRALVTGAAGFAGQWLLRSLLGDGAEVTGLVLDPPTHGVLDAPERDAVRWIPGDVRDPEAIARALDASRPDAIFHLAGVSFVPAAGSDPGAACEVNVAGATRLLGAVRRRRSAGSLDPVVLVVGSAEQYGRHPAESLPLSEEAPQRPLSVYGATKAAQEIMALEAHRSGGVRVVCTRSFNHSGAGQSPDFLLPALVRRVIALRDARRALPVGNLDPVRDYSHVGDVVRAYRALVDRGTPGEVYNVCSGRAVAVREVVARVLARAGVEAELERDATLVRPVDVPALVGDPRKLQRATGWAPERTLDDIIDDLLNAATH